MEDIVTRAMRSSQYPKKFLSKPKINRLTEQMLVQIYHLIWVVIVVFSVSAGALIYFEYFRPPQPKEQAWELFGSSIIIKRSGQTGFVVSSFTDKEGDKFRIKYQNNQDVWKEGVFFAEEISLVVEK